MAERPVPLGDQELERTLADLGRHLAYPPTPDLAGRVRRRLAEQPARPRPFWAMLLPLQRRWSLAVLAVVVLAGAVLAVSPQARTAVAERLGLVGVQIRELPAGPTALATAGAAATAAPGAAISPGSRLNLGQPLTLEQVRSRVPYQVQVPAALGAPDEVYLLDVPAGGQVALVYSPRPDLPPASTTGVGLLLTEFRGNVPSTGVIGKGLPPGTRLEEVQVNGQRGYWIEGDPHVFFYLDARGQVQTETTRLAGNVLLWEQGEVTFRLESRLARDQALRLAATVR